jgi:hypothetical protein
MCVHTHVVLLLNLVLLAAIHGTAVTLEYLGYYNCSIHSVLVVLNLVFFL